MKRDNSEDASFTFEAYVLLSFSRIHAVSCDTEKAYESYAHQSAIDQLYYSIPTRFKGKKVKEAWQKLNDEIPNIRKEPNDDMRRDRNIWLVGEKMQIVSDLVDDLGLLFDAPNPVLEGWRDAGKKYEKERAKE